MVLERKPSWRGAAAVIDMQYLSYYFRASFTRGFAFPKKELRPSTRSSACAHQHGNSHVLGRFGSLHSRLLVRENRWR